MRYHKFYIDDYRLWIDFRNMEENIEKELRDNQNTIYVIDNITYIYFSTLKPEIGL